jgi:hypothetical protein
MTFTLVRDPTDDRYRIYLPDGTQLVIAYVGDNFDREGVAYLTTTFGYRIEERIGPNRWRMTWDRLRLPGAGPI